MILKQDIYMWQENKYLLQMNLNMEEMFYKQNNINKISNYNNYLIEMKYKDRKKRINLKKQNKFLII